MPPCASASRSPRPRRAAASGGQDACARPLLPRQARPSGASARARRRADECVHFVDPVTGRQHGDRHTVDDVADENRLTLNSLLKSGVARFVYTYDFGDNWEHTVVIEKRALPSEATFYPACVGGKRNCPPEDCGGAWGYQHLLDILADPAHPERAEQIEWIGEEFDPDDFVVEIADAAIAARFQRK